jgi:hypothetical protein
MTCSIKDCGKRAIAKGLCSMHYARQLRTGSAATSRAPGRQPDATRAAVLALFPDWSPRTQVRYWKAFRRLQKLGEIQGTGDRPLETAIKASKRANGSLSVSRFDAVSISMCSLYCAENQPGG